MSPLLGFTPDVDATTPGVITDCTMFIPYENGMTGAPTPSTPVNTPALAAACLGATVLTNLTGGRRLFAGTTTKMYELSGGAWVDRSRGGNYSGGSDTRWSFAQFGDTSLCTNNVEVIQRSTGGAFADIAGAPDAKIIFTVGAFVMALNVDDGADKPDGWHCCAALDDTDWVEDVSTQCNSGRLVSAPGEITAGARLGEYAVAYKERAIYVGQYVGSPSVWDWIPVPGGDAGCVGPDALCDVNGVHFVVGMDNFWIFDGTRPIPVGDQQVRQWFYNNSNPSYRYRTQCVFDRQTQRIWVFYPGIGSTTPNNCLVYHIVTKQWGRANQSIEAVLNYVTPGITINGLDSLSSTIHGIPAIPYDSQYWQAGGRALSTFNTSHQLQLQSGVSTASSFTTGDNGDDDGVSSLLQVRLRYASGFNPTSASCSLFYKMNEGDALTMGASSLINDGKFDCRQTARFHRAQFDFTGDVRVTGINSNLAAAGFR